ncbi:MAG TPA: phosphotransferase family protein [Bacilli bacterium]|nr:phosphotransferase family protein [Bacilli bacterium]
MSNIIAVRKGEEIDNNKLEQYLKKELENLPDGSLKIKQFGTGASNLTYALSIGEWEAVLRRAPFGPVAPRAHDMEREYQILSVLSESFSLAPKPLVFCEDSSIVGKPFLLMERKHGVLVDTSFPNGIKPSSELGENLSEMMVDTLVKLHSLDYKGTILEKITKPDGFLERQVYGWLARFEHSKTEDMKEVDSLKLWFEKHLPKTEENTIIHYDYKLNNALFSEDLSKMTGLFDWEMSTVGDPLIDLGVAMSYWIEDKDTPLLKYGLGEPPVTITEGFYTREEFIHAYSLKSGRDMGNIHFYLTFAYFKLAVICQQIYIRYKKGQTNDERFSKFGEYARGFIQYSLEVSTKKY